LRCSFNIEAGPNSTGKLHPENIISFGHEHLALDNRVIELLKMCFGQISFWANAFLGKHPSVGKCLFSQTSFWAIVFLAKLSLGICLPRQTSYFANILKAIFWGANVFLSKCLAGLLSFWANVFWANVFGANIFMGKCLYGQMVMGKCGIGKCHRSKKKTNLPTL
jgi:hypothetical protein